MLSVLMFSALLMPQCDPAVDGPFTLASPFPGSCYFYDGTIWTQSVDGFTERDTSPSTIAASNNTLVTDDILYTPWQQNSNPDDLFTIHFATPGGDQQYPEPVLADSSDPWWYIDHCFIDSHCGPTGDVSNPANSGGDTNGFFFRMPENTKWQGFKGALDGDEFVLIWDQDQNVIVQVYNSTNQNGGYLGTTCPTGSTKAGACAVETPDYAGKWTNGNIGSDAYQSGAAPGDSLRNAGGALMLRHEEWMNDSIGHPLYGILDCTDPPSTFPGNTTTILTTCDSAAMSGTSYYGLYDRPAVGGWFFLDYTDAQITAMGLPAWQETLVTALSHYGIVMGDTCGSGCGDTAFLARGSGWQDWEDHGGGYASSPFYTWIEARRDQSKIVRSGGSHATNPSTFRYTVKPLSGIPYLTGPNCPVVACGVEDHIWLLDPACAGELIGLDDCAGTLTPATQPDTFAFEVPPTTTQEGMTMSTVTVQITDSGGTPKTTASVNIALTRVIVTGSSTLSVTSPVASDANGESDFTDIVFPSQGTYQLCASSAGYDTACSQTFTITGDPGNSGGGGGIAIVGTPSMTGDTASGTSHTHSAVVGSGDNRLLLVCAGANSTSVSLSASSDLDGALTQIALVQPGVATSSTVGAWYKTNPTVGTHVITLTSGWNVNMGIGHVVLSGVDLQALIRASATENSGGTPASTNTLAVTSVSGDLVASCLGVSNNSTDPTNITQNDSSTERWEGLITSFTANRRINLTTNTAAGATYTSDQSWTGSQEFSHIAFSVAPATATTVDIEFGQILTDVGSGVTVPWTSSYAGNCNIYRTTQAGPSPHWSFVARVTGTTETYTWTSPPRSDSIRIRMICGNGSTGISPIFSARPRGF